MEVLINNCTSIDIFYKENASNVEPICFSKKGKIFLNFGHLNWLRFFFFCLRWLRNLIKQKYFLVIKKYIIFKVDYAENVLHAKRSLKHFQPYQNRTSFLMYLKPLLILREQTS